MRSSGILMHISSLPSDNGIGTLGKEAYNFVDFLNNAKQTYWQMLPPYPTSYGDSPYQTFSAFAGNPYFVDLDVLSEEGLLKKSDYEEIDFGKERTRVDYAKLYTERFRVLRKAYSRFKKKVPADFEDFLKKNEIWVSNYALFMSLKYKYEGKPWSTWDKDLKKRDPHALWEYKSANEEDVAFWEFVQYEFSQQWFALKKYANEKGVKIIGDMPIYVAYDSAEVWVSPDLFDLDEDLAPKHVAGCPPDAFAKNGQLWGNPIYNWQRHRETDYSWWQSRIGYAQKMFDMIRIDHFRGFESYYSIPYGDKTAIHGKWEKGPGAEFFAFMKEHLGELPIIAEDLGFLTPEVLEMKEKTGFPGMKVLEFAFDCDPANIYLPHNYERNCVVYVGTHDNNTLSGWLDELNGKKRLFCRKYLDAATSDKREVGNKMIRAAVSSVADTVIIQFQDYLFLEKDARMNVPSQPAGNWTWRAKKSDITKARAREIAEITELYGRA